MSSAIPPSPAPPLRINWKSGLIMLVLAAVGFFVFSWGMNLFLVHVVYRLVVRTTGDLTGINLYLLKALAWAAIALLLFLKKPRFDWLRGINSRLVALFIALMIYNAWMYALTYNLLFRFSDGKPMKWAAVTAEGVQYYASPGFASDGQRLMEVTPGTLKKLKTWDKPLARVDPLGAMWFDANTAEPQIYYAVTSSGDYEFFNRWGYHPQSGAELKPVSPDVKQSFERREKELAERARQAAEAEREKADLAASEATRREAAAKEEEQKHKLRALVKSAKMDAARNNVVLAVDTSPLSGGNTTEARATVTNSLRKVSEHAALHDDVLRPEFTADGYFERAFNGDSAFLKETGIFEAANFLVLVRLRAEPSSKQALGDVFSCNAELSYRLFNRAAEQVDSGSIHAIGPGFSPEAALLRAIEIGIEKNHATFLRFLDPTGQSSR